MGCRSDTVPKGIYGTMGITAAVREKLRPRREARVSSHDTEPGRALSGKEL